MADFANERLFGYPERIICGLDEVGRGCLAGPVVAAAAALPPAWNTNPPEWLAEITDSKALSEADRERLSSLLQKSDAQFAIAQASVAEIDEINIYHASLLAMERAQAELQAQVAARGFSVAWSLVDGNALPQSLKGAATAIIKGDLHSLSIAAASILAKVFRDRLMTELDAKYPGYGHAGHKGYPTPAHKKALAELGVTPIHRRSFGPVRALVLGDVRSTNTTATGRDPHPS